MFMERSVGMVIIRYGSGREIPSLLKQLDSLLNQEQDFNLKLYIINNGPGEFKLNYRVGAENFSYQIIGDPYNRGFAEGANFGLKEAYKNHHNYYVVANTDIIINQKEFFQNLLAPFQTDKTIGLLSPKIYFAPGYEFHKNRYSKKEEGRVIWYAGGIIDRKNIYGKNRGIDEVDKGQFNNLEETDFATGCLLVMPHKLLAEVGGFDERYFLYLEDLELSVRAREKGWKVVYNPHAFLYHKNAQSTNGPGSSLHFYYQERNRLLFGLSYASWKTKLALIKNVLLPYLFSSYQKRKIATDAVNLLVKKPSYGQITN